MRKALLACSTPQLKAGGGGEVLCLNLYASLPQGSVLQIVSATDPTSAKHLSVCLTRN